MKLSHSTNIVIVIFAVLVGCVYSSTIIVAKSGGAFTTIQAGLSAANAGDTVLVQAGSYNEAVSFGKSGNTTGYITLKGEAGAIIDGTGKGELGIAIVNRNYIKVIGMEVQNFKGSGTPIGISIEGSSNNLEIRNNKVHNIETPTAMHTASPFTAHLPRR
jgi:pectin methylesterase-like acyl-CoA thioesterase